MQALPSSPILRRSASRFLLVFLLATWVGAQAQPKARAKPRAAAVQAVAPTPAMQPAATGRCSDDDALRSEARDSTAKEPSLAQGDPRSYLIELIELAQQRSRQVGVSRLLEAAAQDEVREAQLGRLPQLQANLQTGYAGSRSGNVNGPHGLEARGGLQLQGVLWDWGRQEQLLAWRQQLATAAQASRQGQAEQIALQTVSLSLDRSRYQLQAQVYGQYVRKMSCLVEQLQAITTFDKGRSSELVQAQKSQQQAELALIGTQDVLRALETRLRRLVGDPLPPVASLAAVLSRVPDYRQLENELLDAPDVTVANAQVLASQRLTEAVAAGQKPSVSYLAASNARAGNGRSADWIGGLQVNIPLWRASDEPQLAAARKRSEAAGLQRDETVDAKVWRLQELHDAANQSLDRARRVTELLRASQTLRSATLQQWQQLGRRSLFDVMGAEADYYQLRVAHVNAIFDAQQTVAIMGSMGRGVVPLLR
jgi:outer membrane protein TolC